MRAIMAAGLVALALAAPASLAAQLRIGAAAGTLAYSGASASTDPADPSTARPHGSFAWGGAVSWESGAWLLRLGVARSDLGVVIGDDVTEVVARSVLGLVRVEPALARRLFSAREGGTLWLEAGPAVHRWSPFGVDARMRVGGTAAVVWRQRALRRVDLSVRAHVSASPSPFEPSDLPTDMRPTTLWSRGVTLELGWRL